MGFDPRGLGDSCTSVPSKQCVSGHSSLHIAGNEPRGCGSQGASSETRGEGETIHSQRPSALATTSLRPAMLYTWHLSQTNILFLICWHSFFFFLFGATPAACGSFQARGLQLLAYTTATASRDPSRVSDLHHSSRQCQILTPLSETRD